MRTLVYRIRGRIEQSSRQEIFWKKLKYHSNINYVLTHILHSPLCQDSCIIAICYTVPRMVIIQKRKCKLYSSLLAINHPCYLSSEPGKQLPIICSKQHVVLQYYCRLTFGGSFLKHILILYRQVCRWFTVEEVIHNLYKLCTCRTLTCIQNMTQSNTKRYLESKLYTQFV